MSDLRPGDTVSVIRPRPNWSKESRVRGKVVQVTTYLCVVRGPLGFCECFIHTDPEVYIKKVNAGAVL